MKSEHSAAASKIKHELKAAFPGIKFSVKSDIFSGGDAVRIKWTDGPLQSEVESIVKKYQIGTFDGQTDCYEYDNRDTSIPQVKYVQTSREKSEATSEKIEAEKPENAEQHYTWRKFQRLSFNANGEVIRDLDKEEREKHESENSVFEMVMIVKSESDSIDEIMPNAAPSEPKEIEICFDGLTQYGVAVICKLVQVDIDGEMKNISNVFSRFEIETLTLAQLCQMAHTVFNSKRFCFEVRDHGNNTRYPDFTIDQITL